MLTKDKYNEKIIMNLKIKQDENEKQQSLLNKNDTGEIKSTEKDNFKDNVISTSETEV